MTAQPVLTPFEPPPHVPEELRKRRHWIGWVAVWDPKRGRYDKKPICIGSNTGVGYLEPANHVSYEEAVAAVAARGLSGVGFVLTPGDDITGGDCDDCRNSKTGKLEPWAQAVVDLGETYFEVSPSGQGVRFFTFGEVKHAIKFDPAHVELYESGRFLTFTGRHVKGTPREIEHAAQTVSALIKRVKEFRAAAGLNSQPGEAEEIDAGERFRRFVYNESPFGRVNQEAMRRREVWVPELFGDAAEYQPGTGAWRVKAKDLGLTDRTEDLGIHPNGIKWFAIHDTGEHAREGRLSPIDVVLEFEPFTETAIDAAKWLAKVLGVEFEPGRKGQEGDEILADPDAGLWEQWEDALEELRTHTARPKFIKAGFILDAADNTVDPDFAYLGPVAVRPTITDRLTRGLVSMVSASPNVGKSTYLSLEALAIATENGALIGQPEIDWCGHAMLVSNEESAGSIIARWRGQRAVSQVESLPLIHRLTLWPTDRMRLRLGKLDAAGAVTPTKAGVAFIKMLAARAEKGQPVAFLGLDTLVSLFEGIEENSATHMDKAIGLLTAIADAGFIAIDVMHHTGKSGDKEGKDSYRGSSAIFAAVAEMSTFVLFPPEEAERLKMDPSRARRTLRMAGQRQRDGRVPGVWHFEREIMPLVAEDPRQPGVMTLRDTATLKAVSPPERPISEEDEAQAALWAAEQSGRLVRRGASRGRAHPDWAGVILNDALGWPPKQAEAVVVKLIASGRAMVKDVTDPKGDLTRYLTMVEPEKGAGDPY